MVFIPRGIIPPVATPVTEDGKFNEPAYRQLLKYLLDNGVHGLFPFGTTGEFYAFSDEDFRHVLEVTMEVAAGKVPVYAGTNHITTKGTIALVNIAEESGVNAISVLTPMFVSQSQAEVYEYFRAVAESTDLPVIVYNNRQKTNVDVTPETMARLAEIPNIVGVKDSTGDMTNTAEYIRLTRHRDDFHVLMGRDTLIYSALCYGASGAVAATANVVPKIVVQIYERFMAGDHAGALEAQYTLAPLRTACKTGNLSAVVKEGLCMQGINVGSCMPPVAKLTPEDKESLKKALTNMGILK